MSLENAPAFSTADPRIGACVYLLHGLLRRLDAQQPGLIDEMTDSVRYDREAMESQSSPSAAHGVEIADEALRMLRLMSEQSKFARRQEPGIP